MIQQHKQFEQVVIKVNQLIFLHEPFPQLKSITQNYLFGLLLFVFFCGNIKKKMNHKLNTCGFTFVGNIIFQPKIKIAKIPKSLPKHITQKWAYI
jgi:hypothetical protein